MNTPVNFELAKLLKEKGFDEQNLTIYQDGEVLLLRSTISNSQFMTSRNYTAPTIAEVVMWLYEKHGIFIQLFPIGEDGKMKFYSKIIVNDNGWVKIVHQISTIINSPTEAYEAAISHTLNNLI